MIQVERFRNIFKEPWKSEPAGSRLWEPGVVVRDYLPEDFDTEAGNYVALNNRPLTGAEVDSLVPRDGDRIQCGDVPGIVAALITGTTLLAKLLIAIADAIIIAAITIGVSYGIAALSAPGKIPKYNEEDGPTRNFDGIGDTSGNGRPIPFVYGEVRCGGHFLQSWERLPGGGSPSGGGAGSGGTTTLYSLLGVAIGPLESIGDIQLNGQPLEIYNEGAPSYAIPVEAFTRLGTHDQSAIPAFAKEVVHEIVHRRQIRYDDPQPQHFVTTSEVESIEITFRMPNGLFKQGSHGMRTFTVLFQIEWRPYGTGEETYSSITKTVSASTRGPYKDQYRIDDLKPGKYELRITRLTEDDDDLSSATRTFVSLSEVYAISEITYYTHAHPGLGLVGLKQIPSPQLNSAVPTTYTWIVKGFADIRVYSDESTYSAEWSENPAWCCAHFLTHPIIGLGDRYTYDNIDLPSFLAWAAYCDELVDDGSGGVEKRCTVGHIFDEYQPAQDILEVFTQGTGAVLVLWGDKWRAVLDQVDEPVWIANESNVKPDSFTNEWIESKVRANRLHGIFSDREKDYQRESTQLELPDLEQGDAYIEASRELFGVTRRSQVERELTRLLLHNKFADEKVTLKAGLDSLRVSVGSVFGVNMPGIGAGLASGKLMAVPAVDAASFQIDEWVTLEAGKEYEITIFHQQGGSIDTKNLVFNAGLTREIYVEDGNWTDILQVGDSYSLGESSILKFRCISTTLTKEWEREITGLKYDANVYTWDLTSPPTPFTPSLPDPRALPPDPENLILYERQEFSHDGSLLDVIDVDWSIPVSATLGHYEVWWRDQGEISWVLSGTTTTSHFEIKPAQAPGYIYEVAVVSVSTAGVKKGPDQVPSKFITTQGLLTQPPNLGNLQAFLIEGTLVATVDPLDPEVLGPGGYYEWRRGATWNQSGLLDKTQNPRYESKSYARGTTTILVKAVNSVGNKSPTAASISISLYGSSDENIILEQDEHPTWPGTMVGLQKNVSNKLTLHEPNVTTVFVPAKPQPRRGARFFSFGYPDATQKVVLTGYYTTAAITVSGGETVRARADVEVVYSPIAIGLGDFDAATWSFDDERANIPFSGDEPEKVQVHIESRVSTTTTEDAAFSAWAEHRDRSEVDMKYIQFRLRVEVESDAYSVEVDSMSITIDLPERWYAGNHQQAVATSFDVDYPTSYFVSVERLLVSVIAGAVGDTPRVTTQDETGFTAEIRDSGGSLTTGTLHYEALGY